MENEKARPPWRVIGESVRGAAHKRNGMPNQDAYAYLPESGEGSRVCVAVADGHGSARYFRSDVGARLAVQTATEVLEAFLADCATQSNLSLIKRIAEECLPDYLVRAWLEAIEADYANNSLTDEEMHLMTANIAQKRVEANPAIAYGTTLLAVAVSPTFLLFLQLGDGDILTVTDTGEVSRPLAQDKRLIANETTSLCTPHAWREIRVTFQALVGVPPALILLTSDGYANSFRDEAGFLQVGSDLLTMIREDGLESVQANLATWLADASQEGSGDDITLALLYHTSRLGHQVADVMASEQTADVTASEQTADVMPSELIPNIAPSELTPDLTSSELTPDMIASGLTPNMIASELTPDIAHSELTPDMITSELTPDLTSSELTPDTITSELTPDMTPNELTPDT